MRKRLGVVLVAAALAATACSPDPDADSADASGGDQPYRIVQLVGLSQPGPSALNAQAASEGVKAAVAVLNSKGGILGRKVELEIIDEGGNPTTAVTKLQERLAKGPKPNLVLPGNTSAEALPMAPILTEAEIFSVQQASASALDDPAKFPYLFKTPPVPETWAKSLADYAKSKGATKIAMIAGKDAFAQATAEATRKAIADAGLTLSGDETYTAEDLDVTAQLERLRATKPDLLFMQGAGASVGYVLQSRLKIGWTDIPLVADSTSATTSLLNHGAPDGLVGTPAAQNVSVQIVSAAVKGHQGANPGSLDTMITALKKEGEIKLPLNVYYAYDAVMLAAKAAEKAGTITDAKAEAKALETFTPQETGLWALGKYTFTATSHGPAVDVSSVAIIPAAVLTEGQYATAS
ncbi:ABC transporter substrate-binding protein [Micromonospora sp. MP36]|uniref:ABC transporter substrate-binding protein n=1 Tax=Micromonospora sp. MP36 TaxID=2604468 RepID=UPI001652177A|nr:ABC transporter substrate-binding protein [Micromonospora sp. MP36]